MTDELDTLRPEVREALEVCDRDLPETWHSQTTQWGVIRAELLRLAKVEEERWAVVATRNGALERAEKAEAELAALKARIAEAPTVIFYANGHVSGVHESEFRQRMEVVGKHVRLLVVEE